MDSVVLYTVQRIDGDYAVLISENGVQNRVARALLPMDTDEGTKLRYQWPNYEIVD